MWRVSWHTTRPSQRGGECSKTEHKHFTDEEHAQGKDLRFAKRVAMFRNAEWVTTKKVEES